MSRVDKIARSVVLALLCAQLPTVPCTASDHPQLSPVLPAEHTADERSVQKAHAIITAFLAGNGTVLWLGLRRSSDPAVRSQLIDGLARWGISIQTVIQRIKQTTDTGERAALILSLGGYGNSAMVQAQLRTITPLLFDLYGKDPDPEVHSTIDWLLRDRGKSDPSSKASREFEKLDREPQGNSAPGNIWSRAPEGLTMVLVRGPSVFEMGSDPSEPRRSSDETPHQTRIPRTFAISSKEVTTAEFQAYLVASGRSSEWHDAVMKRFPVNPTAFWSNPERPQVAVSWYDAAAYCNWLSREAGIPHDQWVYPNEIGPGMKMPADYLHRTGYRLPTEAEWELAARAGTSTAHFFGDGVALLDRYAWYLGNSDGHSWPVGMLKPNPLGLFDIYGDAWEWLQSRRVNFAGDQAETTVDLEDTQLVIANDVARTRRGGSWSYDKETTRSAHRGANTYFPDQRRDSVGFRVARTVEWTLQSGGI